MPAQVPFSRGRNLSDDTSITGEEGEKAQSQEIENLSTGEDTPDRLSIESLGEKKSLREQYIVRGKDARAILPDLGEITIKGEKVNVESAINLQSIHEYIKQLDEFKFEKGAITNLKLQDFERSKRDEKLIKKLKAEGKTKAAKLIEEKSKPKSTNTFNTLVKSSINNPNFANELLETLKETERKGNKELNRITLTEFYLRLEGISSDVSYLGELDKFLKEKDKFNITGDRMEKIAADAKAYEEIQEKVNKIIDNKQFGLDKKLFTASELNSLKIINSTTDSKGTIDLDHEKFIKTIANTGADEQFLIAITNTGVEGVREQAVASLTARPSDKSMTIGETKLLRDDEGKSLSTATNQSTVEDFVKGTVESTTVEDMTPEQKMLELKARANKNVYDFGSILPPINKGADAATMGVVEKDIANRGGLSEWLLYQKGDSGPGLDRPRRTVMLAKTAKGNIIVTNDYSLSNINDFTEEEIKILGIDIRTISEGGHLTELQMERLAKDKPVAAFSTKSTIDLINVSFQEDTLYPINRILGKNKVRFYGYEELIAGGLDELEITTEKKYSSALDTGMPNVISIKTKYSNLKNALVNLNLPNLKEGAAYKGVLDSVSERGILDIILQSDDEFLAGQEYEYRVEGKRVSETGFKVLGAELDLSGRPKILELPMPTTLGELKGLKGTGISRLAFLEAVLSEAAELQEIKELVYEEVGSQAKYKNVSGDKFKIYGIGTEKGEIELSGKGETIIERLTAGDILPESSFKEGAIFEGEADSPIQDKHLRSRFIKKARELGKEYLFKSEKIRKQTGDSFIGSLRESQGLPKEPTSEMITTHGALFKSSEWENIRTAKEKEIIVGIAEGMKNYQSPHLLLSTSSENIVKNISALDYKQAIASYAGMSGIELDSPLTIMKNNTEIPNYAALTELAAKDIQRETKAIKPELGEVSTTKGMSFWDELKKALKNLK